MGSTDTVRKGYSLPIHRDKSQDKPKQIFLEPYGKVLTIIYFIQRQRMIVQWHQTKKAHLSFKE